MSGREKRQWVIFTQTPRSISASGEKSIASNQPTNNRQWAGSWSGKTLALSIIVYH